MPEIKQLGGLIASREMEFHFSDGRIERFSLRVGIPFEYGDGYDWCCPYELKAESCSTLRGMFGVDALQALDLTMKTLKVEIECWEKSNNGKFYFLDEIGAGL